MERLISSDNYQSVLKKSDATSQREISSSERSLERKRPDKSTKVAEALGEIRKARDK